MKLETWNWSVPRSAPLLCLAAVACLFVGCDSASEPASVDDVVLDAIDDLGSELKDIEGRVVIDGSSTVAPISEAAAEAFEQEYPNVRVTVATSGTGGGFERFTQGEIDISDASRPIKASEFEACKENGIAFVELPIAYDGLSIVVNTDSFVEELTIDDLKKIFLAEGGAKTWKDVRSEWPDDEIKIYAPGTDSGTFDYFFGDVVAKDEENEHPRADMSVSEDDNVLVTGVAGEKAAIGFFGASYYFANKDKIRAVKIVNPETGEAIAPTAESIESGRYAPFSRPLFIYVKKDSLKRPEVKQFISYYLDNAPALATKVDYVALPTEVYELARRHFEDRLSGTHFLSPELEKQIGPVTDLYTAERLVDIE